MPSSLGKQTMAANIVVAFLATLAVILRVIARRRTQLGLHSDDYVIFAALLLAVAICITGTWAAAINIFGKNVYTMTLEQYSLFQKILRIDALFCYIGFGLVKISILLFYKRVFPVQRFKWACYILIAISAGFSFSLVMAQIFSQKPFDRGWSLPPGYNPFTDYRPTYDFAEFLVIISAVNMALDMLILLLPVPLITSLRMSSAKRVSLLAIFGTGFFCIVSSAVRIYYCVRAYQLTHNIKQPYNITEVSCWNDVWGHIEVCASIVAATLPTLAPLFKRPDARSSTVALFFSQCVRKLSPYRKVRGEERDSPSPHPDFSNSKTRTTTTTTTIQSIPLTDSPWRAEKDSMPAQPQVIYVQKGFGYREENMI